MSRTTNHHRSVPKAVSALALLTLTAGALTACSDQEPTAEHAPSTSTSSEAGEAATLHMIDNGGHRVAFYVTPGDGQTIVLDSGGGEDASQWKDLVPQIHEATGATVITYDRAGLGKSDVVPGPWSVESAVSDLEAGLEQLGVTEDVTLVSHSQAGEIATYFANDNPGVLSAAILVDANLPQFFTDAEIARLVAFSQPDVDAARENPENPANRQLISTADSFVATSTAFHQLAWPDDVPATVIVSEKTPFDGSPEDVQLWKDAAASFVQDGPNRTLVTAKGSSHEVPTDDPALVLKEIETLFNAQH